jgi:PDZ domain
VWTVVAVVLLAAGVLRPGDTIVAVDGQRVDDASELRELVQASCNARPMESFSTWRIWGSCSGVTTVASPTVAHGTKES